MKNKPIFALLLLLLAGYTQTQAQKVGFVDVTYVITQMPEYQKVQEEMKAYEAQIKPEVDAKQKDYETKVEKYKELAAQTPPPTALLQSKLKEIQALEQEIGQMQQDIQREYQGQLAEKMAPVNKKFQETVSALSAENGNMLVLRQEALYYQVPGNNISDMILKKLGITPTEPITGAGNLKSSNKIGVFDANAALPKLPEVKRLEQELKTYSEKLREGIEKLQLDLQKTAQEMEAAVEAPEARRKELAARAQELQSQLVKAQQDAQEQYANKRDQLLQPIYDSLEAKIKEVATQENYTYVLRIEASLMEPEQYNITEKVLQKMGVDTTASE